MHREEGSKLYSQTVGGNSIRSDSCFKSFLIKQIDCTVDFILISLLLQERVDILLVVQL